MAEQRGEARDVDAGNVIYINPGQMQELADGITNLVQGIRQDKQQNRQFEVNTGYFFKMSLGFVYKCALFTTYVSIE